MAAEIPCAARYLGHVSAASMRPRRMAAEIGAASLRGLSAFEAASMRPRRMAAEIPAAGRRRAA